MTEFEHLDKLSVVAVDGYSVAEWTPDADGAGVPEQVHLVIPFEHRPMRVQGMVALRLKSPRALDELVAVLLRHRANVWGGEKG